MFCYMFHYFETPWPGYMLSSAFWPSATTVQTPQQQNVQLHIMYCTIIAENHSAEVSQLSLSCSSVGKALDKE